MFMDMRVDTNPSNYLQREIIKAIIKKEENIDEALQTISSIVNAIIKNKDFGKTLKEELHNKAIDLGYCPLCYTKLKPYSHKENRGEYLGFPSEEVMTEWVCPDCLWKDL